MRNSINPIVNNMLIFFFSLTSEYYHFLTLRQENTVAFLSKIYVTSCSVFLLVIFSTMLLRGESE